MRRLALWSRRTINRASPLSGFTRAESCQRSGSFVTVNGHRVHVVDRGQAAAHPPVLVLHGFPGSSHDWHAVLPAIARHTRVVAFDFLGYGLSDKPIDERYSLFEYADLAEALALRIGLEKCVLLAHDIGDTVAAELLARANEARSRIAVVATVLTNGSIFIDMAQLSPGQLALLALPDEPLADSFPPGALRPGLEATFAPDRIPRDDVLETMEELIRWHDGDRLLPRLIRYIDERRAHQPRWTAALVEHKSPLTVLWGERDPIAVVAMVDRLCALRSSTLAVRWHDVGHWPSLEAPDRVSEAVVRALRQEVIGF